MLVVSIIGGRPNLIKVEPVQRGLVHLNIDHQIIDVGVYNRPYGPVAFQDLQLPEPNIILNTRRVRQSYLNTVKSLALNLEKALAKINPALVLVYGDLDACVAAVIAAAQAGFPVYHIEAGLRNHDTRDTEEINRLTIDRFARQLLATSESARQNLLQEGMPEKRIHIVGNTIIDALRRHLPLARYSTLQRMGLQNTEYGLVTIHRQENLAFRRRLRAILEAIRQIQEDIPLVFIQYSSTVRALKRHGIQESLQQLRNLRLLETVPYHDYLGILRNAAFAITDSSGIQDETTYLGIPCLTCRHATHRTDTLTYGTNRLVNASAEAITQAISEVRELRGMIDNCYPMEWNLDVGHEIATLIEGKNG